jgi:hypothetical protein
MSKRAPRSANRHDMVGLGGSREAAAQRRNLAKWVPLQHERAPAPMPRVVAALMRRAALFIAQEPICFGHSPDITICGRSGVAYAPL